MGGHGALILALKNPGKYKVRYSPAYMQYTKAYTDLYTSEERKPDTKFCYSVKYMHSFSCSSSLITYY